jgi:hypothetical protein
MVVEAAHNPEGVGFSWCNDTGYPVMASLGIVEMGAIATRGWYRVEAGTVMRKPSTPMAVWSNAEMYRSPEAARSRCARATAVSSWPTTRTARRTV